MRRELKSLQQRVNITVIFVTHDQVEALSLSDRIAIMKFGVLEQVGTPEDVYFRPATPFVRDFLGKTFLLSGKIAAADEQTISVEVLGSSTASLQLPRQKVITSPTKSLTAGQGVTVAIRPEQVNLSSGRQDGRANMVEATLQTVQFLGDRYEYTVTLGAETRVLASPEPQTAKSGDRVYLELKPEGMTLWPTDK
jgi:ABC-type Fe3+/spermidine/putrescine transport system ATPase subunit